jgi:AAHS family 4-hydroxybenzoate transporter-like MFS transporter
MMLGVGRLGAILGPFSTGLLQQVYPGSFGLFAAIGVAVLLGACAILFARPRPAHDVRESETSAVVAH